MISNVRSVTVNSVSKYLFADYDFNGANKTLTLNTGATVGWTVTIVYDYISTAGSEKIYPDYPREDLGFDKFPRIGLELTSQETNPLGLGGTNWISDIVITVYLWVPTENKNSLGGTEYLNDTLTLIRQTLQTNAKSFKLFQFITPGHTSPIIKGKNDKIMQQSQDYMIRFLVE
jgi:hypothetical protein